MAKKTAQNFINQYNGTVVDYDGVYGAQCVDAFKIFCAWLGVPVKPTKTGWADGYWTYRIDYKPNVDYVTDVKNLNAGDWLFWTKGSSCPLSHVGMFTGYADKEKKYGLIFSENQGGNGGFCAKKIKLDILGGFRFHKLEPEPEAVTPTKSVKCTGVAHSYDAKIAKTYYAMANLNCRNNGSKTARILVTIPQGTAVTCYGYYEKPNWYYAQALVKDTLYTGFFSADYLSASKVSPVTKALVVGAKIRIRNGAMQYGKTVGFADKVYKTTYTVSEISGNRVVFKAGAVTMGAVAKSDCIVQ